MTPNSNDYFDEIDFAIDEIKRNNKDSIVLTTKIVDVIEEKIKELHLWLINYKFETSDQEIYFFKVLKPKLISKLIYYSHIIDIESNAPISKNNKIKYYKKQLDRIAQYAKEHKIFYQYYRSGYVHNDLKYFTRNRDSKMRYYDCHIINYDIRVSTLHDFDVAQIMANDSIVYFIENKLQFINSNSLSTINSSNTLQWTGNKVELVELIYALQTQKAINNGTSDIKELSAIIGQTFNIELEDSIYRCYLDIKNRKSASTKFLNALAENLNNRILEED
jgi:RteC protein